MYLRNEKPEHRKKWDAVRKNKKETDKQLGNLNKY